MKKILSLALLVMLAVGSMALANSSSGENVSYATCSMTDASSCCGNCQMN